MEDRVFIIIQARMTSTRLAAKVMLPLCNKTVLEVMIDRIKEFKDNIVIATTNDGTQKPIVDICEKLDLKYYKGDTNNVLSRYYEAALKYEAKENDIVVRLTSDCPLLDKDILKSCIDTFKKSSVDYLSCGDETGFPRGMDVEIFKFSLLKEANTNATTETEKEHVTVYMHTTIKDKLNILEFKNSNDDSRFRITLDEEDDYELIKQIYEKFDNKTDFSYEQLIDLLKSNPTLVEMNSNVKQKEV